MMDPELKAKWVAALRSGNYHQAQGTLIRFDDEDTGKSSYCCLGVLCRVKGISDEDIDMLDIETNAVGWQPAFVSDEGLEIPATGSEDGVSLDIRELLAKMNDGEPSLQIPPKDFKEIADWIERNL